MAEHEHSGTIDASPDEVFAYLRDVSNLPRYFPGMTRAEHEGDDAKHDAERVEVEANIGGNTREGEGWFRVDEDSRKIEWGALDDNGYQGRLAVEAEGDGSSLSLWLSTPHVDEGQLDLEDSVERVRAALARDAED